MSISVFYEESIIYQAESLVKLELDNDLLNVATCHVIADSKKYYFHSFKFGRNNDNSMYIIHQSSDESKLIFKINLETDPANNPNVVKFENSTHFFNNFIPNLPASAGKTMSLSLRKLFDNLEPKKKVSVKKDDKNNLLVEVSKKLYLTEKPSAPEYIMYTLSTKFGSPTDVNLKILSKPGSITQKCKRVGYANDTKLEPSMTDRIVKEKQRATDVFLSLFFIVVIFGLVIHTGPGNDFVRQFLFRGQGGGQTLSGGGQTLSGGSCAIPDLDSFEFRLPTPNILGYFKMSVVLLFLNMMIFAGNPVRANKIKHNPPPRQTVEQHTSARKSFIGTGITVMVLAFIVILIYKDSQASIFSGLNFISLTLYNPDTIAIYPAILAYVVFYTNFIKLVQNDVELPEFMMFFVSFLLLSGYAMFASFMNVNSFRSISFIAMMTGLVITLLVVGGIIINDIEKHKKKEQGQV